MTRPCSFIKQRLSIPISLVVSGNYPTIRQFLEDILQLRRAFIIDTVVFSKTQERGQEVLRATITLDIPYFGDKQIND